MSQFKKSNAAHYKSEEIFQEKKPILITELEPIRTPCMFCHQLTNRTYKHNNVLISACKICASQRKELTISLIFK